MSMIRYLFTLYLVVMTSILLVGCKSDSNNTNVPTNTAPTVPSNPSPSNNSTGIASSTTLSWTCIDAEGNSLSYDVYLDSINPPTIKVATVTNGTALSRSGLILNKTYFWKVIASDGLLTSVSPIWQFSVSNNSSGISGDWICELNSVTGDRLNYIYQYHFVQSDTVVSGYAHINDSTLQIRGTIVSNHIDYTLSAISIPNLAHQVGHLTADTLTGTYSLAIPGQTPDSGSWHAHRGTVLRGKRYSVYGANSVVSGVNGYRPQNHGYTLLGTSDSSMTFYGHYNYYSVVTFPVNTVLLDAIIGSDGHNTWNNLYTGNTSDHSNMQGSPNNICAHVGGAYGSSGGFVTVDASGLGLNSIRVIVGN